MRAFLFGLCALCAQAAEVTQALPKKKVLALRSAIRENGYIRGQYNNLEQVVVPQAKTCLQNLLQGEKSHSFWSEFRKNLFDIFEMNPNDATRPSRLNNLMAIFNRHVTTSSDCNMEAKKASTPGVYGLILYVGPPKSDDRLVLKFTPYTPDILLYSDSEREIASNPSFQNHPYIVKQHGIWSKDFQMGSAKHPFALLRHKLSASQSAAHSVEVQNNQTMRISALLMEYVKGDGKFHTLFDVLFAQKAKKAAHYLLAYNHFWRMYLAVLHLHANKWAHADIKPDQFLLTEDGGAKLIDFGIAEPLSSSKQPQEWPWETWSLGSEYLPPEMWLGVREDQTLSVKYSPRKRDAWQVGSVFLEVVCGKRARPRDHHKRRTWNRMYWQTVYSAPSIEKSCPVLFTQDQESTPTIDLQKQRRLQKFATGLVNFDSEKRLSLEGAYCIVEKDLQSFLNGEVRRLKSLGKHEQMHQLQAQRSTLEEMCKQRAALAQQRKSHMN